MLPPRFTHKIVAGTLELQPVDMRIVDKTHGVGRNFLNSEISKKVLIENPIECFAEEISPAVILSWFTWFSPFLWILDTLQFSLLTGWEGYPKGYYSINTGWKKPTLQINATWGCDCTSSLPATVQGRENFHGKRVVKGYTSSIWMSLMWTADLFLKRIYVQVLYQVSSRFPRYILLHNYPIISTDICDYK